MSLDVQKLAVAKCISNSIDAPTAKEIAVDLGFDPKKTAHFTLLSKMIEENHIERFEGRYYLTDLGRITYLKEVAIPAEPVEEGVNPNQRLAMEDFERHLPEPVAVPQPTALSPLEQITQIMVEAEAKAQALFLEQTPREIANLEIKIDLLRNTLLPIVNPYFGALLMQIADDLERV